MATDFINKGYFGGSRALAVLLAVNTAASILLWTSALVLKICGLDTSILYTISVLPSDALSFALHPWTIITYSLAHFDPLHLLFNMLWLYWFGRMLADAERDAVIIWLYAGGAILGGIFYIAVSNISGASPGGYLAGASAAVLSVMTACALRMPERRINLFIFGEVRLKWFALVCIILTFIGLGRSELPVLSAHLGGILFGVSWFFIRRRIPRRPATSKTQAKAMKQRRINTQATVKAMNRNIPDDVRLDQLLDKIRMSGYDSLTSKEKTELNYISSRLGDS